MSRFPKDICRDVDLFVGRVDEDLLCPIQRGVLPFERNLALASPCGHTFCQKCISAALEHKSECPNDRLELSRDQLVQIPVVLSNILRKLVARCDNVGLGCQWKGPWESLDSHIKECDFELVDCMWRDYGCIWNGARGEVIEHTENCEFRFVECAHCSTSLVANEIDAHLLDCVVACSHCQATVPKAQLGAHIASCPCKVVECDYKPFGCTSTFQQNGKESHLAICSAARISATIRTLLLDQDDKHSREISQLRISMENDVRKLVARHEKEVCELREELVRQKEEISKHEFEIKQLKLNGVPSQVETSSCPKDDLTTSLEKAAQSDSSISTLCSNEPTPAAATTSSTQSTSDIVIPQTPRDFSTTLTGSPTLTFDHSFKCSWGIAVSPSNLVFVTDSNDHSVSVFDGASGRLVRAFGSKGVLNGPTGIAFSTTTNQVFVCDHQTHRVQVFTPIGDFVRSFGSGGSGPGQLKFPLGISIDQTRGEVHVCDRDNHRICVFSEDGRDLFSYGGPGQLNKPTGVAVDGERGIVFVADGHNARVNVFRTNGEFVSCFGHKDGDIKGQFGASWNAFKIMVADNLTGNVVVSDNGTKRVQILTREGEWVSGFGWRIQGLQFEEVRGAAIGREGQLYVCCKSDGKWQVHTF